MAVYVEPLRCSDGVNVRLWDDVHVSTTLSALYDAPLTLVDAPAHTVVISNTAIIPYAKRYVHFRSCLRRAFTD